jgi:hypothetical protein
MKGRDKEEKSRHRAFYTEDEDCSKNINKLEHVMVKFMARKLDGHVFVGLPEHSYGHDRSVPHGTHRRTQTIT